MLGASHLIKAALIGAIIYLLVYFVFKQKRQKVNAIRSFFEYIFVVYMVAVFLVTGVLNFSSMELCSSLNYNIIPFQSNSALQFIFNIFLFIPAGVLIPIIFKRKKWTAVKIFVAGLFVTLFIEIIQLLFVGRAADINDILSNTLGCMIGYCIYKLGCYIYKRRRNNSDGFNTPGLGTLSILLNILAAVWGATFNRICVGDIFLSYLSIPTWSGNAEGVYSLTGMHYSSLITFIFLIPAFYLGYKNQQDFGAKSGMKLSVISGVFYVAQFVYYLINS